MFSTELQEEENEDTAVQSDIFPRKLLLFLFIPTPIALIWATIIAQLVHCSSLPTVLPAPEACSFLIYFITLKTEWTFYRANVISPPSFKSFFQSLLLLTCKDPVSSGLGLLFILISQFSPSCSLGSSHAVTHISFNIQIWVTAWLEPSEQLGENWEIRMKSRSCKSPLRQNLRIVDNDSQNYPLRLVPRKVVYIYINIEIFHYSLDAHRVVKSPTPSAVTLACPFACQGSAGAKSERHTVGIRGEVDRIWGQQQRHHTFSFFFLNLWILFFYTAGYWSSILYTSVYTCQSQSPNSSHPHPHPPPLSPLGVHMFVLYICVSISAL